MHLISPEESQKLIAAFNAGFSIRGAARYAGVAKNTSQRYFNQQPPMLCPCGKALPHRSWCAWRVALSPGRQNWLAKSSFVPGGIKPSTWRAWDKLRLEVMDALSASRFLVRVDQPAMIELRRFYDPSSPFAFECSPASSASGEDQITAVGVQHATQEDSSYALFAALERLHPSVQKMLHAIIDGASIDDAAKESGIGNDELRTLLPRLRIFLAPYVGRTL